MDKEKIGDRLVKLREHLGKNQNKMAISFDVIPQTLSKYERNEAKPNSDFIARVLIETNVNPWWLILGKGQMFEGSTPGKQRESPADLAAKIQGDKTLRELFEWLIKHPKMAKIFLNIMHVTFGPG